MGLLSNINAVSQAITDVLVATAGLSKSVTNLVDSSNHATAAIALHASELEAEAKYECQIKAATRAKKLKDLKA